MTGYRQDLVADADALFGRRLREFREEQGISQQALVDKLANLGVTTWHQTTVGKVESGTRPVRLAEALAVSEIFGLSIDEFLSRTPTASEDRAYRARLFTARRAELGVLQTLIEARERQLDIWIDTLTADQDLPADMPELPTYHLEPKARPADEPAERDIDEADDVDAAAAPPADAPPSAPHPGA